MRLNSSIKEVKGIGDKTAGLFLKINIETIRDLISYFPRTYVQFPEIKRPDEVVEGETAAVIGQIRQTPVVKRVQHADHGDFGLPAWENAWNWCGFGFHTSKTAFIRAELMCFTARYNTKTEGLSWSSRQFIRRKI